MSLALAGPALGGAVLLGWLEWRRPDSGRRLGRVCAAVLAVVALAGLALPPLAQPVAPGPVVLVTEGATPALANSLADSLHARIAVLDEAGDARRFGSRATRVPDVAGLVRGGSATSIAIAGWGLGEAELDALGQVPVAFTTGMLPSGLLDANWTRRIALGDRLHVAGTIGGGAEGDILRLDDPAGPVDSVRLTIRDSTFALSARPRTDGLARYTLGLRRGNRVIAAETLGVEVRRQTPPRMLVLDGAPSFETKYLREWTARSGGAVSVRTTISRGRYRTLHVNRPAIDLRALSARVLGEYDVIVADGAALETLGAADRAALEIAVREHGLGLVVRGDAAGARIVQRGVLAGFTLTSIGTATPRVARPVWDEQAPATPVPVEPVRLMASSARPLVRDTAGVLLAAWKPSGAGAVALTIIASPSRWQLAGASDRFADYWRLLIGRVARPDTASWEIGAAGPILADEPLELRHVGTAAAEPTVVVARDGQQDSIFLAQDRLVAERWAARFWPRDNGWHRIGGGVGAVAFDVRGRGEWKAWQAARRRRATTSRMAFGRESAGRGDRTARPTARIPGVLLLAIFVGAAAFLWMSEPPARR